MTTATRKRGLPFKRLSKAAKERAIEKQIEWLHQDLDTDWITEQLNEQLQDFHGYPDLEVSGWSLGHRQGDGVDIEGSIDIGKLAETDEFVMTCLAKGVLLGVCDLDDWDFQCRVKRSQVELEWRYYGGDDDVGHAVDDIGLALDKHLNELVHSLQRKLSEYGYDEIDYLTSEEYAIQRIEDYDDRFTRDGRLIR